MAWTSVSTEPRQSVAQSTMCEREGAAEAEEEEEDGGGGQSGVSRYATSVTSEREVAAGVGAGAASYTDATAGGYGAAAFPPRFEYQMRRDRAIGSPAMVH